MTSFRAYREQTAADGGASRRLPTLPSDAIAFQGDRAGFVSRAVAAIVDVVLVFAVVLLTMAGVWMLSFIVDPMSATSVATAEANRWPAVGTMIVYGYVLNVAYWTIGWATGGRTVGNLVMGLRVVNFRGERLRWAGALARALFCTVFVPGLVWVVFSGANRSVQDTVLRTSVIYDWVVGVPGLTRGDGRNADA